MGKFGTGELILVLVVALLIFGPSKLPALGKMAGKAIGTLRHYADSNNWGEFEAEEDETPAKPVQKTEEAPAQKAEAQEEPAEEAPEEKEPEASVPVDQAS